MLETHLDRSNLYEPSSAGLDIVAIYEEVDKERYCPRTLLRSVHSEGSLVSMAEMLSKVAQGLLIYMKTLTNVRWGTTD